MPIQSEFANDKNYDHIFNLFDSLNKNYFIINPEDVVEYNPEDVEYNPEDVVVVEEKKYLNK